MNDDELQAIWNKGKQQEPTVDQVAINLVLEKAVRSGWSGLRANAWGFLAMLIVSEVFNIMNLLASVSHPRWLVLHAALTGVTLGFFVFGLGVLRALRTLDDPAATLTTLVRRQLRFFHTTFEWWLVTWALTVWMVSFCIVVWVENEGGVYRVGHVVRYAAVSVGLILGSYALMRLGHYPMRRRSLAALHDLESQIADQTVRAQSHLKYWAIGTVLLVIALTASVAWTCNMWLSVTP